ncbi:MAG: Family A G protein-coupled receptor-like protein [Aureobasidium pullulans]|nr:MAG: Family A G protein-coupled receptor-like protein [Aureobasidium pullulans]
MEAAVEKQNDLINLPHENKIALSEAKAAAAQSAATVTKIIDENMQLKHEVERLQAENKELRLKLWDATEEERMMNAGRLGDVLKVL